MRKNSRSREAKDGRSGIGQRCVARATDYTVHCIRVLVVVVFEREMWQQGPCGSRYRTTPAPVSFDCCIFSLPLPAARTEKKNGMTAHGALVSGGITRLSRLWWRRLARLQSSCCVVRSSAHVDCDGVAVPSDHVVNDWNGALKKRWECRARMSNGNQLGCPREEKQQAKGCDLENRRLRLTEDGWNIAL